MRMRRFAQDQAYNFFEVEKKIREKVIYIEALFLADGICSFQWLHCSRSGPVHSVPIFRSGEQFTYTQHYNICYGCKDEDF